MTKFLLVSSHFLPNDGGIARLITELSNCFKNSKYDYSLLLLEDKIVTPDLNLLQIRQPRILKEIIAIWHVKRHKDIIISSLWYPDGWIASFSPAKKKVILLHGSELLKKQNRFKEYFLGKMRRNTLNNADLLIANSQFTAKFVQKNYNPKKLIIINPGTDTNRFSPSDKENTSNKYYHKGKFILSTLSVIRQHKGLETLLQVIVELPENIRKNILLNIGGKGDAEEYYKSLAKKLKISNYINWQGFIPENELPDFYRASNLFLLTSKTKDNAFEGFGMVLTEAQSCGVPVIGTYSGGISDAVEDGNGGYLIKEDDIASLNNIIIELYNNPEKLKKTGKQARLRIKENLSWKNYFRKLEQAIEEETSQRFK